MMDYVYLPTTRMYGEIDAPILPGKARVVSSYACPEEVFKIAQDKSPFRSDPKKTSDTNM